jgi:hypothetical protein
MISSPSRACPLGRSGGKCRHNLIHHARLLPTIARGKVKWLNPAHLSLARKVSGGCAFRNARFN